MNSPDNIGGFDSLDLGELFNTFFSNGQGTFNGSTLYLTQSEANNGCSKDTFINVHKPCSACNGRGKKRLFKCQACKGSGRVYQYVAVAVRVPKGTRVGDSLTFHAHNSGEAALVAAYTIKAEIMQAPSPAEYRPNEFAPYSMEELTITKNEAADGCKKTIVYPTPVICHACSGRGYQYRDSRPVECAECSGSGCKAGEKTEEKTLSCVLTIPKNTKDGTLFRLKTAGAYKSDGSRGCLFVTVHVR